MIPFWKNPRTDLSPLGDETVARIYGGKNEM